MNRIARALFAAALAAPLLGPVPAWGQTSSDLAVTGLLRTGFRVEAGKTGGKDGFAVYDARLGAEGRVGIVFDYRAGVEYDTGDESLRLIDASLSVPLRDELLRLRLGLGLAPLGGEATADKARIPFVERSQATLALAPGRQIGVGLEGRALEGRLGYGVGLYNGNGPRFENDGDGFLWVARASWNSVGEVEFFEDFVFEAGAGAAYSEDDAFAALPVSVPGIGIGIEGGVPALEPFTGSRWILGGHARVAYRTVALTGEYLRAEYDELGGTDLSSEGWFLQASYSLWGALEWQARFDAFRTAAGRDGLPAERSEFLVLGVNVLPGLYGRLGLQYAIGLDGSLVGPSEALDGTHVGPRLADGQFLLNLQVAF
jgi:hypothetical protein